MRKTYVIIFISLFVVLNYPQDEGPIKTLYSGGGFEVRFIFYSEGNGINNNGVVLLLSNRNNYEIQYSFELIFHTPSKEKSLTINGKLKAGERKTGSSEGLYFIPFDDKSSIAEVGITRVRVLTE